MLRTHAPFLLERLEGGVLRVAYRGASRVAPDNTLEAIRAATACPVDFVEVDAHLTRDGQLLLWHDPQFVTPEGVFEIAAHTLADLRALGVPDGTLATVPDAVEAARGRCGLMLDLKADGLEEPICEALRALDFRDIVVCGGYWESLARLGHHLPEIAVSYTPDEAFYRALPEQLRAAPHLDALTVYWRTVGPEMLQAARETGTLILAWTVDYQHVADHLVEMGVNGITSNDMRVLAALR